MFDQVQRESNLQRIDIEIFSISRYNPGVESEHNSTGTCVTEQGAECKVLANQRISFNY